jgi:hypothetical protein
MPAAKEGDIGSVARAQDLSYLCRGPLDVAGAADQRHDIADIDPGIGAQRSFAAHPRECTQEDATRAVADALDDLLEGPAMKLAIVDQHLNHIAGDCPQNLVGIDLSAYDGSGGDNGGGRTGNDDVVAVLENRVQVRLDIGAFADNSLDDGAAADLVLNRLDRSARASGHAIGPRLKLAIGKVLGLWRGATRKLSFKLGRLLLEVDSHELRRDERNEQEREDVAEHIGDGIARRDVRFLLVQHILRKSQLRQRTRCGADHRGLRQGAGGETGCGAGIKREYVSETENDDETGAAEHQRQDHLCQGAYTQRSKEFGPRSVADGEHEQTEQDTP